MALPALSVVILTRDRPATLRRALDSIRAQHYRGAEVIVVDNGSGEETLAMLRDEYGWVRTIENGENLGIAGRNIGYRAATAEFILSLDDDIELCSPDTLTRVVAHLRSDPSIGALTLKICEEATGDDYVPAHWWHPPPRESHQDRIFETDRINEAAVAFRARALSQAGYYFEDLFWGGEEWDLVMGLVDAGYRLVYEPIKVLHLAPRGDLNVKAAARHVLLLRNRVWIAFRRLPPLTAVRYTLPRLILWLGRSIRYGYLGFYLKGLLDLVRLVPRIRDSRKPISRSARDHLDSLRPYRPQPELKVVPELEGRAGAQR